MIGALGIQNGEFDRPQRRVVPGEQLAQRSEATACCVRVHGRFVRRHHRSIVAHRNLLCSKQHFAGTRFQRIGIFTEDVTRDHLRELMDEYRRHIDVPPKEPGIGRLERARLQQPCAQAQPNTIVIACIGIVDRIDLGVGDVAPGIRQQRVVQCKLG